MFSNDYIFEKVNNSECFTGLQNLIMYSGNLKKIRKELDISAQKMADSLNVSRGAIVQYETSKRKPSYEFIEALHTKYNVNLNWFVSGQGEMFIGQDKATAPALTEQRIKELFNEFMAEKGLI